MVPESVVDSASTRRNSGQCAIQSAFSLSRLLLAIRFGAVLGHWQPIGKAFAGFQFFGSGSRPLIVLLPGWHREISMQQSTCYKKLVRELSADLPGSRRNAGCVIALTVWTVSVRASLFFRRAPV